MNKKPNSNSRRDIREDSSTNPIPIGIYTCPSYCRDNVYAISTLHPNKLVPLTCVYTIVKKPNNFKALCRKLSKCIILFNKNTYNTVTYVNIPFGILMMVVSEPYYKIPKECFEGVNKNYFDMDTLYQTSVGTGICVTSKKERQFSWNSEGYSEKEEEEEEEEKILITNEEDVCTFATAQRLASMAPSEKDMEALLVCQELLDEGEDDDLLDEIDQEIREYGECLEEN